MYSRFHRRPSGTKYRSKAKYQSTGQLHLTLFIVAEGTTGVDDERDLLVIGRACDDNELHRKNRRAVHDCLQACK